MSRKLTGNFGLCHGTGDARVVRECAGGELGAAVVLRRVAWHGRNTVVPCLIRVAGACRGRKIILCSGAFTPRIPRRDITARAVIGIGRTRFALFRVSRGTNVVARASRGTFVLLNLGVLRKIWGSSLGLGGGSFVKGALGGVACTLCVGPYS